jgi:6-hydroxytryprostatin B O-methyltransferase
MTNNLFQEPIPGYVAHTGASSIFVRQPTSAAWILHNLEDIPTAKVIAAMEKWGDSQLTTETASQLGFEYLADKPESTWWTVMESEGDGEKKGYRMQRFGDGMSWASGGLTDKYRYLIHGFDWAGLGSGTVVDVSLTWTDVVLYS